MSGIKILIEGDYALFSRPELKVERVSYDVPTVSALCGLIKSVYWKPAVEYVIDEIVIFNPIRFINIRRNECTSVISLRNMQAQMCGEDKSPVIYTSEDRTQRNSLVLKNVKYGVRFHLSMTGNKSERPDDTVDKHYSILCERLKKGQWFRQPCLGCSEFPAKKIELVSEFDYGQISPELRGDRDLGYMVYNLRFADNSKPVNGDWDKPVFSNRADAAYYHPHIINGVINVEKYREGIVC